MTRLNLVVKNLLQIKTICGLLLCITCFVIFIVCFIPLKESSPPSDEPDVIDERPRDDHKLCVLVPYRNAFEELVQFVPHISEFLNRQSIDFRIVVIDHVPDGNRFNKGSVFNAGFKIISKVYPDCDYIALHDIDLLPLNDELSYAYPGNDQVVHVAHPDYHPLGHLYIRDLYIGGIVIISNEVFIRVNGFGNSFWGWGFEDQNFSLRLKRTNYVSVTRPSGLATDRSNTFKDIHAVSRKRDVTGCPGQVSAAYANPDFITGVSDVKYEIAAAHSFKIDEYPFSLFGVSIPCNFTATPWCKPFCKAESEVEQN